MMQAMNTGHDGSITTVHANSPRDALSRVETMMLMAGMDLGIRAIREQIASALNVLVHQTRMKDGVRRITHITEIVGMEGDIISLQDLALFDYNAGIDEDGKFRGQLQATGLRPRFVDRLAEQGISIPADVFAPDGGRRK
jgi:pilus assembly protein CpaF